MGAHGTHRVRPIALTFNRSLRLAGASQQLSSDGGALLLREYDDGVLGGFTGWLGSQLVDQRDAAQVDYSLSELVRSRLFMIGQGWRDQSDADRLRHDPALSAAVADRRGPDAVQRPLASQSTHSRLIDMLALKANRHALRDALVELAIRGQRVRSKRRPAQFTLDVDGTALRVHGSQAGARYNGYFRHEAYHPLLAFVAETGDLVGAKLRPGNAHDTKGAWAFMKRLLDRMEGEYGRVGAVRGDAAFANQRIMELLEERGTRYAFRKRRTQPIKAMIAPYVDKCRKECEAGPPSDHKREWFFELVHEPTRFTSKARRMVLVVVEDPERRYMGQPGMRSFVIVTNFTLEEKSTSEVVAFYRQRGTAETRIGEFKREILPLLSSPRMCENEATFALGALAYQLAHGLRLLATTILEREEWFMLGAFRDQFLKVAIRFTRTGRRLVCQVAEAAWGTWTRLLARLAPSPA